jgi:hypothetical protein
MSFSTEGSAVYLKLSFLSKQLDKNVPVLLSCLELAVNTEPVYATESMTVSGPA